MAPRTTLFAIKFVLLVAYISTLSSSPLSSTNKDNEHLDAGKLGLGERDKVDPVEDVMDYEYDFDTPLNFKPRLRPVISQPVQVNIVTAAPKKSEVVTEKAPDDDCCCCCPFPPYPYGGWGMGMGMGMGWGGMPWGYGGGGCCCCPKSCCPKPCCPKPCCPPKCSQPCCCPSTCCQPCGCCTPCCDASKPSCCASVTCCYPLGASKKSATVKGSTKLEQKGCTSCSG